MISLLVRFSHSKPTRLISSPFSPLFQNLYTTSSTPTPSPSLKNPILFNYLIDTFNFPYSKALELSNRYSYTKTSKNPPSVLLYLKSLQFSDAQIKYAVSASPQILFTALETILMPKICFFQSLGLSGSRLPDFLSKHSQLLTRSLHRTLIPCIDIMKKVLSSNVNDNHDLFLALSRCSWIATSTERLSANLTYFEKECGIRRPQVAMLMKRQPRIFIFPESHVKGLVARALEMGFLLDSKMLVHGIFTLNCIGVETYNRKLKLLRSFGFSEDECREMFRKVPSLLRTSEAKLRFGLEFFLETNNLKKSSMVQYAGSLMYSMEERVVPRYRVLEVLKEKGFVENGPSLLYALRFREEEFVEKFISRFPDDAEELLMAYKSHLVVAGNQ
ncbi:Mitochondrial transcription termination factor family protein [Forsythia ovata]|uniref:Mitochondrial transcription termination factor family protein n=1 Tax=Forsythia ovata TaxID=205694 RepID=A0ABD1USS6_9LAMI